jgi:hypothetical protein
LSRQLSKPQRNRQKLRPALTCHPAVGDKYPNTRITGIDLSPIQPTLVPENVHFFVDDFEEEWIDPEDKYDLIHLRNTLHSVKDPKALLERAIRYACTPTHHHQAQLRVSN